MTHIDFLSVGRVKTIHENQIRNYGGRSGIVDENALASAVAQPYAMFGGKHLYESLYMMAAVYLFGLVHNHPFVDGNKRVATVAAIVFLEMNGILFEGEEDELSEFVLKVIAEKVTREEISKFLEARSSLIPLSDPK